MRRTERIPGYPGIYRILKRDHVGKAWCEPIRGAKFGVKISAGSGEHRREQRKLFRNFHDAKAYWRGSRLDHEKRELQFNSITFGELVEKWKSLELPNKARSTQIKYLGYLRHFQTLELKLVREIRPAIIDALIVSWKSPSYLATCQSSRVSFDHELVLLKSVLGFYRERFDQSYVLPFLRAHNKAVIVRKKVAANKDLTLDEYHRFIEALRQLCLGNVWEPLYYLARTQYWIFGRIQEAAALHFEDFDFDRKTVNVNKRLMWLRTPGQETYIEPGLKAGSSKEIPMSRDLEGIVREWMLKSGRRCGPMFLYKEQLLKYRAIQEKYSQALKRAGLSQSATHVVRHAALCEAYEVTRDILTVQKLAGHKDLESTSRYAKAREQSVRQAVEQFDSKFEAFRTRFVGRNGTQT